MKLIELEPQFIRYETRIETYSVDGDPATWNERGKPCKDVTGPVHYINHRDVSFEQAQGVMFLCPVCFQKNNGDIGTHYVDVTFANRGVADEEGCHNAEGKPTRWQVSGTGFDDLTITPSIQLIGGCTWHGFITNGEIR